MTEVREFFEREPWWEAAFEQAWASWRAGSLGIGAVIVDTAGTIVASGRNRVLEPAGSGRIAGTLLAHAEMNAMAELDLGTGEGLCVYTTVEPCVMCLATMVAIRVDRVRFAVEDPVFDGVGAVLGTHPYCADRLPESEGLDMALLSAVASLWPFASRAWAKPGQPPREEWLVGRRPCWDAAVQAVSSGLLTRLVDSGAPMPAVVEALEPVLRDAGAL